MWQPSSAAPIHWQWQIGTDFNISTDLIPNVTVYDIDMFDTPVSTVATLHAKGFKVIAYIDIGTYEPGRPDDSSFPASVLGNGVQGWAGEKWLDVRNLAVLQPIMQARFNDAASKGFDAVELDNMDGCTNSTGFSISTAQQLAYDEWCMQAVHALGMSCCQKNWIEECSALSAYADFCLNEEAYFYGDPIANLVTYYVNQGKAVFEVEYKEDIGSASTPQAATMNGDHINSTTYDLDLVGPTQSGYLWLPCIPDTQSTWSGAPAANSFLFGYVGNNNANYQTLTWSELTHATYGTIWCPSATSAAIQDAQGLNYSLMASIQAKAKSVNPNIKFLATITGGNWQQSWEGGHLTAVLANATLRGQLAANLAALVSQYNLDGIDIDWEGTDIVQANYHAFLVALRAALPIGKLISVCMPPAINYQPATDYQYWLNPVTDSPYIDMYEVMSYGETFANFQTYMQMWFSAGFPVAKMNAGYDSVSNDSAVDDITLIPEKVAWTITQGIGGQMIWEADATGAASYLTAIYNALNSSAGFTHGTTHTASFSITELPAGISCQVQIQVGTSMSSKISFTSGNNVPVSVPITMPAAGKYSVYIDVYMEGILVETVTDPAQVTIT